jgi:hypothetical protein
VAILKALSYVFTIPSSTIRSIIIFLQDLRPRILSFKILIYSDINKKYMLNIVDLGYKIAL